MSHDQDTLTERSYQKEYYRKNRYRLCQRTLNEYCFHSMRSLQMVCQDQINEYLRRYPFEVHGEVLIRRQLARRRIHPGHGCYSDCFDAGMLAYLYSIHRCAYMGYTWVDAYIKKMIRIYINCALIVYDEPRNLCSANNLTQVYLDHPRSYNI